MKDIDHVKAAILAPPPTTRDSAFHPLAVTDLSVTVQPIRAHV